MSATPLFSALPDEDKKLVELATINICQRKFNESNLQKTDPVIKDNVREALAAPSVIIKLQKLGLSNLKDLDMSNMYYHNVDSNPSRAVRAKFETIIKMVDRAFGLSR